MINIYILTQTPSKPPQNKYIYEFQTLLEFGSLRYRLTTTITPGCACREWTSWHVVLISIVNHSSPPCKLFGGTVEMRVATSEESCKFSRDLLHDCIEFPGSAFLGREAARREGAPVGALREVENVSLYQSLETLRPIAGLEWGIDALAILIPTTAEPLLWRTRTLSC